MSKEACIFCEIVMRREPATIVREWNDAIAIVPLNPVVDGHILVLSKYHVESFFSDPAVSADTMRRAAEMLHGVERHLEPRDHNIITSAGKAATQTVKHLHVHIVPREHGDGLQLPWSSQQDAKNGKVLVNRDDIITMLAMVPQWVSEESYGDGSWASKSLQAKKRLIDAVYTGGMLYGEESGTYGYTRTVVRSRFGWRAQVWLRYSLISDLLVANRWRPTQRWAERTARKNERRVRATYPPHPNEGDR